MNITQESTGKMTGIIHINLKEDDYAKQVSQKLKKHRKKASMPGFRPGMVPMAVIKKIYGKTVLIDEINKTIADALNAYIIENKLNLFGAPLPNKEKATSFDVDMQSEFDFYFDIAYIPEMTLEINKDITVPYYTVKISDSEFDVALDDVLVRYGKKKVTEEVAEEHTVTGNIKELDKAEKLVDSGFKKEITFAISDINLKKNQKTFIGKKVGEKISFVPSELFDTKKKIIKILGVQSDDENIDKNLEFEITSIFLLEKAELAEDLFKKIFPDVEIKTEEEFGKHFKENIENYYLADCDKQFVNDSIAKLMEIANIKFPTEFLKRWLYESNEGKISQEQIELQYDSYVRSLRWQLIEKKILENVANKEDILVADEEVKDAVRSYFTREMVAEKSNSKIETIVEQVLKNQNEKKHIHDQLYERKLLTFFKTAISRKEEEVSKDKFNKIISKPNNA